MANATTFCKICLIVNSTGNTLCLHAPSLVDNRTLCSMGFYLIRMLSILLCAPLRWGTPQKDGGWGVRWEMSLAVEDPAYFLSSLLQDTAGWKRPGNHIKELQAGSFYSGWREEQGARLQSYGKLDAFQSTRGSGRFCCKSKLMK